MEEASIKSTSVVFLCGKSTNGRITLSDKALYGNIVHGIASDGDDLIALCRNGCYNLENSMLVPNCDFMATNFCSGKKTVYALSTERSSIYSWGLGPYGELGLGLCTTIVEQPVSITHKSSFISISCGDYHCTALDTLGNAYSWGQNYDRQLGLHKSDSSKFKGQNCVVQEVMFRPALLPFSLLCPISKISCGARFTVAIGINGDLWSWGAGECGQLGSGRCTKREVPTKILIYSTLESNSEGTQVVAESGRNTSSLCKIVDIACGDAHVLAVGCDGSVHGWGMNKRGQLGLGDSETRHSPSLLPYICLSKVYANGMSSAGISPAGDLFTWGSGSKFRLMQQKDDESNRIADDSHRHTPTYVDTLYGNIVHSFVFSDTASAALVVTRLYELSPSSGPQKSFKELLIQGCGFWDSDRIVVTFTNANGNRGDPDPYIVNPNPKPRSAPGRLSAPGVISCKPPRLAESGEYEVTVSLDGVNFVRESLPLSIYTDITVRSLDPKLLDRRVQGPSQIVLTLNGFVPPLGLDPGSDPVLYDVRLLLGPLLSSSSSSSSSGSGGSRCNGNTSGACTGSGSGDGDIGGASESKSSDASPVEAMVQGVIVEQYESENRSSSAIAGSKSSHNASAAALDIIKVPEYRLVCDVSEALKSAKISNLFSIRAQVTMNGVDYSAVNSDSKCMVICHAFQPISLSPTSCQSPCNVSDVTTSKGTSTNNMNMKIKMKEVRVCGESFFPSRDLPSNLFVQGILSASIPTNSTPDNSNGEPCMSRDSVERNEKRKEVETVSIVVPVRCTSQKEMFFIPPTLNEMMALFKNTDGRTADVIDTTVEFQLVTLSESHLQDPGLSDSRQFPQTVYKGDQSGVTVQSLSPSITAVGRVSRRLSLRLFNPQPISISPVVCRRSGGTLLTVSGKSLGGLKCCPYPDLVQIHLTALGVAEAVHLSAPDVTVLRGGDSVEGVDVSHGTGENAGALAVMGLDGTTDQMSFEEEKKLSMHSNDVNTSRRGDDEDCFNGTLRSTSEEAAKEEEDVEFKFQFLMPDMSSFSAEDSASVKAIESVSVSLLLDGTTALPNQFSCDLVVFDSLKVGAIVNPKGGYAHNSQVSVVVLGMPSIVTDCVVQIRGDEKDKNSSGVAIIGKNYFELQGMRSKENNQEVIFTLPDSESFSKIVPVLIKKAKMYYVDISIDGGSSFDSSASAILQVS